MGNRNLIKEALLGVAVGDALGVPVEFVSRGTRRDDPVTGMREKGTHNQPAGTWSDDTSLTLCLAEMLCKPYSLKTLAGYFINWKEYAFYTAGGYVFDIGIATSLAIQNMATGAEPKSAGGKEEFSNGNGSLMRILPLVFYIKDKPIAERFSITRDVSSLTHGHIRSVIACFIYLEYARLLISGRDKVAAYEEMRASVAEFLAKNEECPEDEVNKFHRILELKVGNFDVAPLRNANIDEIYSTGYVVDTLEASLWCLLQTSTYKDAGLRAVNLGDDTDTTGAVTGGLAGLLYGNAAVPEEWLQVLAKRAEIENLAERLNTTLITGENGKKMAK